MSIESANQPMRKIYSMSLNQPMRLNCYCCQGCAREIVYYNKCTCRNLMHDVIIFIHKKTVFDTTLMESMCK